MTFEPGRTIGGKYRLETEFARGGMGAIWRATHCELEVPVAVKIVTPELGLSPIALSRFKQEARAAAQLRSPHVVQILDYGVEDGAPFMVMELLTGSDLSTEIERGGRLPPTRVVAISAGISKALRLAHDAQIVHRDLKPENVFLARLGDDEVVKVLDFGIAKALSGEMGLVKTGSSTLIGSPLYMSPEQSRGEPVDIRTDLWSYAVVLFEALTGDPPFKGRGLGDVFAAICTGETPVPAQRGILLPGLDEFFRKALAKEREDRFASAKDLHEAFARCVTEAEERGVVSVVDPARTVAASSVAFGTEAIRTGALGSTPPRSLVSTQAAISSEIKVAPRPRGGARRALFVGAATLLGCAIGGGVWLGTRPSEPGAPTASQDAPSQTAAPSGSAGIDVRPTDAPSALPAEASSSATAVASAAPTVSSAEPLASAPPRPLASSPPPRPPPTAKTGAPTVVTAKPTNKPDDTFGVQ
jgi:eukaryotic-like serine/threonine-protein kinase